RERNRIWPCGRYCCWHCWRIDWQLVAAALGYSPRLRHCPRHHRRNDWCNHSAAHSEASVPKGKVVTRRTLPFLFATAILLAGLDLSFFEIVRAEGLRPFVLFGAVVMVVAGAVWLLYEFVLPR